MPGSRNRGQFLPGNPGGPGRPRRATEESYAAAIRAGAPPAVVTAILKKLVAKALDGDGDVKAAVAVLKATCGNDAPAVLELEEKLAGLEREMEEGRQREQEQPQA